MRIMFLLAAGLLSGCAITAQPFVAPDGKEAFEISCPGTARSMASCMRKAGEMCGPAGYDILGKEEMVTPWGQSSAYINPYGGSASGMRGVGVARSMYVRCREVD